MRCVGALSLGPWGSGTSLPLGLRYLAAHMVSESPAAAEINLLK